MKWHVSRATSRFRGRVELDGVPKKGNLIERGGGTSEAVLILCFAFKFEYEVVMSRKRSLLGKISVARAYRYLAENIALRRDECRGII